MGQTLVREGQKLPILNIDHQLKQISNKWNIHNSIIKSSTSTSKLTLHRLYTLSVKYDNKRHVFAPGKLLRIGNRTYEVSLTYRQYPVL